MTSSDLSRAEYIALLEAVEIALWVLEAHHDQDRPETRKYRALEQKVFQMAEAVGCGDLVEYDEDNRTLQPTLDYEEMSTAMNFMRDFENDCFWEQLILRLAERDVIRQVGEQELDEMIPDERAEVERPHEDRYFEEFKRNGLENITLRS